MGSVSNLCQVDAELLAGWLGARSLARGLPQPVHDHGGLRLDTGLPNEWQRYVFATAMPAIRELARTIETPLTFIKLCGPAQQLLELVPERWQLQSAGYLMVQESCGDLVPSVPDGYRIELSDEHPVTVARIFASDGSIAASGYAAECDGVFIFDRIITETAHQRRGLGRALMAALGSAQRLASARRVLVATDEGRTLYSTLGWSVLSPFSTVMIPAPL